MPKWKKDTKEFEVGVNYVKNRGYSVKYLSEL